MTSTARWLCSLITIWVTAGCPATGACGSSVQGQWSAEFGPTGLIEYGTVKAAATLHGDLIVAGMFQDSARDSLENMARWDGRNWHPFGNQLTGINSLIVWRGQLYAGGSFRSRTDKAASVGLMRWDGTAWEPTIPPLDGEVFTLVDYRGSLVAGGCFTAAGDEPIRHLAAWNGQAWRPIADGISGGGRTRILALATDGDNLAVGGIFTQAGRVAARNVAVWDGTNWSACGAGTDDAVAALCTAQGRLYAGGIFHTAGDDSASGIAAWDGRRWTALGSGLRGNAWLVPSAAAIAAWRGGIVVGGSFIGAGGHAAGGIATWDGADWQPVPPGNADADRMSERWQVHVLTTWDNKLAVGGQVAAAPGNTLNGVGLWDGSGWVSLGTGQGARGYPQLRGLAGSVYLQSGGIIGPDDVRGTALWRDDRWRAFAPPTDSGLSFDATLTAMAERDGRLLALGRLRDGPRTPRCDVNPYPWHLAELGQTWKVLSPPLPRERIDCKALLPLASLVVAVGNFGNEEGIDEGAMIWDGRNWRAGRLDLDGGTVAEAAVVGDRIVVAVRHASSQPGARSTCSIIEGDGESWRSIRAAGFPAVTALGSWEGKLVAAFEQPFPELTEPSSLQAWDGETWSPIPGEFSGMFKGNGRVQALAEHQGHLVAAGSFRGVDGRTAENIAFLDDGVWRPLGGGVDSWVAHLASTADGLWLGGSFRRAGDTVSLGVAHWDGDLPVEEPIDSIPPYEPRSLPSVPAGVAGANAAAPAQANPELVTNGDLRTWGPDNTPAGWVWQSWCPSDSGPSIAPPAAAPGGSGVRLRGGDLWNCWSSLYQSFAITGGRSYRVRARFDPVTGGSLHGNSGWLLEFTDFHRNFDGEVGASLHTGMEVPVPKAGGWIEVSLRTDRMAAFAGVSIKSHGPAPEITLREVSCDTIAMTDAEVVQAACAELQQRIVIQSARTVDWDSLRTQALARLEQPGGTARAALIEFLRGVGEPRITVESGASDTRSISGYEDLNPPPATDGLPQGRTSTIRARFSDWNGRPDMSTGWTQDNLAYALVSNPIVPDGWLTDLAGADGLLVDLRDSGTHYRTGISHMSDYRPLAAWFIDGPKVWGYARDEAQPGAPADTLRLEPVTGPALRVPMVCLIDGTSRYLSAECALMLKGVDHVTLVGRPTGGGTGGIERLVVATGFQIGFPARSLRDPEGRLISDDHGVDPDVHVAPGGAPDPVLEEGLKVLRRQVAAARR